MPGVGDVGAVGITLGLLLVVYADWRLGGSAPLEGTEAQKEADAAAQQAAAAGPGDVEVGTKLLSPAAARRDSDGLRRDPGAYEALRSERGEE